jgi:hypothetical protein
MATAPPRAVAAPRPQPQPHPRLDQTPSRPIPRRSEHEAATATDHPRQDLVVTRERSRHHGPMIRPQLRRTLDVREQERHRARRPRPHTTSLARPETLTHHEIRRAHFGPGECLYRHSGYLAHARRSRHRHHFAQSASLRRHCLPRSWEDGRRPGLVTSRSTVTVRGTGGGRRRRRRDRCRRMGSSRDLGGRPVERGDRRSRPRTTRGRSRGRD